MAQSCGHHVHRDAGLEQQGGVHTGESLAAYRKRSWQRELTAQGDDDLLVREAESPGARDKVRSHAAEQLAPTACMWPSLRSDTGAAAATGGE
jgi:hypothetical protein